jgi:pimeloyl-ACP methyl ester carboxylesterase
MSTSLDSITHDHPVHYATATIKGLEVFYRDAGPRDAPTILLLHGFPTSSNMFRNLIPLLSDSFRLIAPDYPGFGLTTIPDHKEFSYTFHNLMEVVDGLVEHLGLKKYSMYVMDYGAPIGYRLALRHPERVQALIIQNGNAYDEGLLEFWNPIKKYWGEASQENREAIRFLVAPESTKWQYETGVKDTTLLDPTTWLVDQVGLDRPGNAEIQLDLFYDYRTNVPLYPDFQAFFRNYQPPTLIVWGKNDMFFIPPGARAYLNDLPDANLVWLYIGQFVLDENAAHVAA